MRDDYVVERGMAPTEAREPDLDHHGALAVLVSIVVLCVCRISRVERLEVRSRKVSQSETMPCGQVCHMQI